MVYVWRNTILSRTGVVGLYLMLLDNLVRVIGSLLMNEESQFRVSEYIYTFLNSHACFTLLSLR